MRRTRVGPRLCLWRKPGSSLCKAGTAGARSRGSVRIPVIVLALVMAAAAALLAWRAATGISPRRRAQDEPGGARTIVSLAPSITEIVFSLGAGDRLVGVTDACDYPPQAQQLTTVGPFVHPNLERILALEPDMVIAGGPMPRGKDRLFASSGIQVVVVSIRGLGDVFTAIETIAEATGQAEEGAELIAGLNEKLAGLPAPLATRPTVFFEIWNDPLTSPGRNSFLTEVVEKAGGRSITADLPGDYVRVSPDFVLQQDPDVIVMGYMTGSGSGIAALKKRIGWAELKAVESGMVLDDLDSDVLLRPGPRLVDAIEELAGRLALVKGTGT